jgi:hypothetical protein
MQQLQLSNTRRRRGLSQLSVANAFKAQGVQLKYPSRSRSGIRWEDGVVVIAIDEADVRASADRFRCLLWSPVSESSAAGQDRPILRERREHARLAARHGSADGLLVRRGGLVDANAVLALRVERRRGEYWATWGSGARVLPDKVESVPAGQGAPEAKAA